MESKRAVLAAKGKICTDEQVDKELFQVIKELNLSGKRPDGTREFPLADVTISKMINDPEYWTSLNMHGILIGKIEEKRSENAPQAERTAETQ